MTSTTPDPTSAPTVRNPAGLHDPTPFGYSHTAAVPAGAELVVVAGQYGSDLDGIVVAGGFDAQVERAVANLATALDAHGLGLADVVQLRTYVVGLDLPRLGSIGAAVAAGCGGALPPQTVVGVAALALPEILVEVEAVAART